MKIIGINGSPRKNGSTQALMEKALKGAEKEGIQTELIHLYDLSYKGCTSCLACKAKNSRNLGRCVYKDDLRPVLERIDGCDGLILGSPIYIGDITAMMRAFLERLLFQYHSYDDYSQTYYKGSIKAAFIYTMNVSEEVLEEMEYHKVFQNYQMMLSRFFKYNGTLLSTETLQVNDYSKYHMGIFNEEERIKRRAEVFPKDCQKAYNLGRNILKESL